MKEKIVLDGRQVSNHRVDISRVFVREIVYCCLNKTVFLRDRQFERSQQTRNRERDQRSS